MSRLVITNANGETCIVDRDRTVSVGRRAEFSLGSADRHLHSSVFELSHSASWAIAVPRGNRLWVDVLLPSGDRQRLYSVPPGDRHSGTSASATLRVRTVMSEYCVSLMFDADPSGRRRPADTQYAANLDPGNTNDRALIAACRDRLDRHNALAVSPSEVARVLGIPTDTAAKRITRAAGVARVWAEMAGTYTFGDRSALVDWLVCTGVVDSDLYKLAVANEKNRR